MASLPVLPRTSCHDWTSLPLFGYSWSIMSSRGKPNRTNPPLQKEDWIAWTFHLIFGGVVGLVTGCLIARWLMRAELIGDNQLILTLLANGLILGGLASHFGERRMRRAGDCSKT
jgi:hypothetical protein